MKTKEKIKTCDNVCVKIRKTVMEETLEYLRKLKEELKTKTQQVA